MKLLFLDMHGVMSRYEDYRDIFVNGVMPSDKNLACFKPDDSHLYDTAIINRRCLSNLLSLVKKTKAQIVLTSSLRKDERYMDFIKQHVPLSDILPFEKGGEIKGDMIKTYVDSYDFEVTYAIVDDDENEILRHQYRNFVKANEHEGLTKELTIRLEFLLNG